MSTIESIGSSTRIEGSELSDRDVERLKASLEIECFALRDEQEVAVYAEAMELVVRAWADIAVTENHQQQPSTPTPCRGRSGLALAEFSNFP